MYVIVYVFSCVQSNERQDKSNKIIGAQSLIKYLCVLSRHSDPFPIPWLFTPVIYFLDKLLQIEYFGKCCQYPLSQTVCKYLWSYIQGDVKYAGTWRL